MPKRWDPKQVLLERITQQGGWVNAHAHIDRAYSLTKENFALSNKLRNEKWTLNSELRKTSTVDQIYDRMARAIERMLEQHVTVLGSFIDVDGDVKDKAIKAAIRVREKYKDQLTIKFLNQSSYGLFNEEKEARHWFEVGAEFVDIIGGLLKADHGREAEHLDILLSTAKHMHKMVHVHVDEMNVPEERETEMLANKTIEHGMQGKVVGIHGISINARPLAERQKIYRLAKKADLMFISCPVSWLNSSRSESLSPIHNPLTPVDELLAENIPVAMGTDNIADIFMPFNDADMWLDLRILLEAARIHDLQALADIATKNGRKVLGLDLPQPKEKIGEPFYNPHLSYEQNFAKGPFGAFATKPLAKPKVVQSGCYFLGFPVNRPFGIPAGPLINSAFVSAAFQHGFDVCTYKTVRSRPHKSHPLPNILAVHITGNVSPERDQLVADDVFQHPLSITNSFGVPSKSPDWWQPDMAKAVKSAKPGQILIGSFQGTRPPQGNIDDFITDYVTTAKLVKATGAQVLEANLSCPNEGTSELLCFDIDRVVTIATKIKDAIGSTPLILKIGYFSDDQKLSDLVSKVGSITDGISAINTMPAEIVTPTGEQALPGEGRLRSGVCGNAIRWAGLEMVHRLINLRVRHKKHFSIIGVGGVMEASDYLLYRKAGADAVMSATGAMWNPALATQIAEQGEQ